MSSRHAARSAFLVGASFLALFATPAFADEQAPIGAASPTGTEADDTQGPNTAIIVTARTTRSASALPGVEMQKILPGINPLKAIETLPGVTFITSDPWGNNEQNTSLFIHGFNAGQLGYTLDDVPLGDQNYGNYNGLSPQRAVISENVGSVTVSTGAGDLRVASTSNLGGAIETLTSDPHHELGAQVAQTIGSYGASRTYARIDSGDFADGTSLYLSGVRQRARAWDFNGRQGGYQANAKLVHENAKLRLTLYFAYSDKIEPNEDATTIYVDPAVGSLTNPASTPTTNPITLAARRYQPYTRPFFYPDFAAAKAYIDASGRLVDQTQSVNYRNYYSDAQRTDYLGYFKLVAHLTSRLDFSTQQYFHHDDGVGVVAGPLQFVFDNPVKYYYPQYFTNPAGFIASGIDNSGYIVRTTEYRIDRTGNLSQVNLDLGAHKLEAGVWYEYNSSSAYRRWYALDQNNLAGYSPYIRPSNPLFTQYGSEIRNNVVQLHLQDTWTPTDRLTVEAGFKSSLQFAKGYFTVQPIAGSLPGASGALPNGSIDTKRWFLPAVGARWRFTDSEEVYANVQKNLRQYQTYGGGGAAAPWSVGSQAAFDTIAQLGKPESSWTYEVGLRSRRSFGGSFLSAIEAQVNYYHVAFSNRLLAITPPTAIGGIGGGSITGGTPSLFNVGSVHTDGVDAAATLHFGPHFSIYDALSYNTSTYQSDYTTVGNGASAATGSCIGGFAITTPQGGVPTVPTCGKQVPGSPKWLNKTVVSANYRIFDAQLVGDYVGKRYATFVNDAAVGSFFLLSGRIGVELPLAGFPVRKASISVNVTNITQEKGVSTVAVGSANNTYNVYPIPPRQWFATFGVTF